MLFTLSHLWPIFELVAVCVADGNLRSFFDGADEQYILSAYTT